jgi:hypothetical protein
LAIFFVQNIAELAAHLNEYFPEAVARITKDIAAPAPTTKIIEVDASIEKINSETVREFRLSLPSLPQRPVAKVRTEKNPRMIFVLSPPRSGSTLLRIMLAGNPRLFSPPELELLSFNTLGERKQAFTGKFSKRLGIMTKHIF